MGKMMDKATRQIDELLTRLTTVYDELRAIEQYDMPERELLPSRRNEGVPPAKLDTLEKQVGTLSPSFRAFLSLTDGLSLPGRVHESPLQLSSVAQLKSTAQKKQKKDLIARSGGMAIDGLLVSAPSTTLRWVEMLPAKGRARERGVRLVDNGGDEVHEYKSFAAFLEDWIEDLAYERKEEARVLGLKKAELNAYLAERLRADAPEEDASLLSDVELVQQHGSAVENRRGAAPDEQRVSLLWELSVTLRGDGLGDFVFAATADELKLLESLGKHYGGGAAVAKGVKAVRGLYPRGKVPTDERKRMRVLTKVDEVVLEKAVGELEAHLEGAIDAMVEAAARGLRGPGKAANGSRLTAVRRSSGSRGVVEKAGRFALDNHHRKLNAAQKKMVLAFAVVNLGFQPDGVFNLLDSGWGDRPKSLIAAAKAAGGADIARLLTEAHQLYSKLKKKAPGDVDEFMRAKKQKQKFASLNKQVRALRTVYIDNVAAWVEKNEAKLFERPGAM